MRRSDGCGASEAAEETRKPQAWRDNQLPGERGARVLWDLMGNDARALLHRCRALHSQRSLTAPSGAW